MFGYYCRLLEAPQLWDKVGLHDDCASLVKQLHEVREVRNVVLHFNISTMPPGDIQKLRTLAPFFRSRVHQPGTLS